MHYNNRCLLTVMTSKDDPSEMDEAEFLESIDDSSSYSRKRRDCDFTDALSELDDGARSPGDRMVADGIYKLADSVPMRAEFVHEIKIAKDRDWLDKEGKPRLGADYRTVELSVTPRMTEQLLTRIADEVKKREKEGHKVNTLILGQPQYSALEAYAWDEYHDEAESILPVDEVIVVPGPMIHAKVPNRRMLMEYESED